MVVASRMAGLSLEEGDRFRKAVQKRNDPEQRQELKEWFVRRCARRGVPRQSGLEMWEQMDKFRSYSFCKSHACGYGQVSYQCAYLKRHFPAEFMVAVMNHHAGMYSDAVHIEEAKRMGVSVLLPCVNRSGAAFTLDEGALRIGLGQVRGVSQSGIDTILAQRERQGGYESLNDLLARVAIGQQEIESLVLCGGFDFTGRARPELIWELRMTYGAEQRAHSEDRLFRGNYHALRPPKLNDFSSWEKLTRELDLLEVSAGAHVLEALRPQLPQAGISDSRALHGPVGRRIRLYGMLDARRTVETEAGNPIEFVTFEDEYGLWECTLFSGAYRRYGRELGPWGPYLIEGTIEEQYSAVTVRVTRLKLLSAEAIELTHERQKPEPAYALY